LDALRIMLGRGTLSVDRRQVSINPFTSGL